MKYKYKIIGLIFIIMGLLFLLYPLLSMSGINLSLGKNEIFQYDNIDKIIDTANKYNELVAKDRPSSVDPFLIEDFKTKPVIEEAGEDSVGVIYMPTIGEKLPIYLGATKANMKRGACQVDGTSLPFGGNNTRSVLAAHNGNYFKFDFHNINKLEVGDPIYIYTLGERLQYKVLNNEIIYPTENEKLKIVENEDMLTLLTCTPYPINDKRLLVNAIREEGSDKVKLDHIYKDIKEIETHVNLNNKISTRRGIIYFSMVIILLFITVLTVKLIFLVKKSRN